MKKSIWLLAVCIVTFSVFGFALSGISATHGNVDGSLNESVDLKDAIISLQISAGIKPSGSVIKENEVSGDGVIGLEEAIYALQVAAGIREIGGDSDEIPQFYSYPEMDLSLNFENVRVNESRYLTISIANNGEGILHVDFFAIQGLHADDFRAEENVFPLSVEKGSPQSVKIICSPSEEGTRKADLLLTCNDPEFPIFIKYPLQCEAKPAEYCNLNTYFDIENNRSIGSPGKGYDSDRDRIKSSGCLEGEFEEVGFSSSDLVIDQITNYEELYKKITSKKESGFNAFAVIPFFFDSFLGLGFGEKDTSKFTSEIQRREKSESFVYTYEIRAPNHEWKLDTENDPLNGLGKSVKDSQCKFRSTCGDQFVYQIERGGSLYVALSFNFKSEFHKETFQKTSKGNFGISLSTPENILMDIINGTNTVNKTPRPYSKTKSYFVLDIVTHENETWVCVEKCKGQEPTSESIFWKKKGDVTEYDASKAYSIGDFVNFEGSLWGCLKATCNDSKKDECKNQGPGPGSTHWKKFEEPNEEDKKDLASVEASWNDFYDSLSQETKKNARLTIHALQIGGDATELSHIFSDQNGDQTASLSCSLVNDTEISPCKEAISRIVQYAASEKFIEDMKKNPAILDYRYRPYEEAGVFMGLVSELTHETIQSRENLAAEFERQTGDKEFAEFKLEEFKAMLNESEKTDLEALIGTLEHNIKNLKNSASVCFSDLPSCENSVEQTLANLLSYDQTLLDLPIPITVENGEELLFEGSSGSTDIQRYAEIPPDYVLTGIGVETTWWGWPTVKLQARRINANGTLGEQEVFGDADHYPTFWIEVPEEKNYVIIGVGVERRHWKTDSGPFSSTKDHVAVKSLHVWYREFDPVNRKLTGEIGLITQGGANLEAQFLTEDHGLDVDHAILKGVGMGLKKGSSAYGGLKIKIGYIE